MLRIRPEQMQAFDAMALREFENSIFRHLRDDFADQCARLGEDRVREAIHYGIGRAESYGLGDESDVAWYIDLMFLFGRDFDRDPRVPWAAEILTDERLFFPGMKSEQLLEAAQEHEHLAGGLIPKTA